MASVLVASAIGAVTQWQLLQWVGWDNLWRHLPDTRIDLLQQSLKFLSTFLYGSLACFAYVNQRTARLAAERLRSAELARAKSRRRTLESRLQAMQARVEPEFLFNTLAQVRTLYEKDGETAGRMLEDLIAYLRAALPHLRDSSSTLGQEIALARAYLDIVRIRLGDSLSFTIDLPESLADATMPAMILLPLIDQVLSGDAPNGQGRRAIHVGAAARDGRLALEIVDSGDALQPGTHTACLDAIEQRLQAISARSVSRNSSATSPRTSGTSTMRPASAT
jgi:LytS/YehU family sensor histidine kinase